MQASLIGRRARFSISNSNGSVITFTAPIVKLQGDDMVWIEMPARVRRLPFPPLGGKRYGLFPISTLVFA
jgi:hypothetical protein